MRGFCSLESGRISVPQKKQPGEQCGDRCQPTRDRTDVITLHVQPWIERIIWQAIDGWTIDQEVERIQCGVALARSVAIQVRIRDTSAVKLLHTTAGPRA